MTAHSPVFVQAIHMS